VLGEFLPAYFGQGAIIELESGWINVVEGHRSGEGGGKEQAVSGCSP